MNKSKLGRIEKSIGMSKGLCPNCRKQEEISKLSDDELEAEMLRVAREIVIENMKEDPEWYREQLELIEK